MKMAGLVSMPHDSFSRLRADRTVKTGDDLRFRHRGKDMRAAEDLRR